MKKTIPALSAVCFTGALATSIALVQTDWSFSLLFKVMLLFLSSFIGLTAYWKSDFNKWIAFIAFFFFGGLSFILFKTDWYALLWNYVLAGHVLLVGYSLYRETKKSPPSFLQKSTSATVICTVLMLIVAILIKTNSQFIYNTLFIFLLVMSVLIIANKFFAFFKEK